MKPTSSASLSPDQFQRISRVIQSTFGVSFSASDRNSIARRLGERLCALQLSDYEPYVERMESGDATELSIAMDILSVNETYFFREEEQLAGFSDELLPQLCTRNRQARTLNIWSIGCSSGEEVYTIAMLLKDSGLFSGWRLRVFGSDVSSRMVTKARRGMFSPSAFRNTSAHLQRRHFHPQDSGWRINDDIRALCNFSMLNLLDENATGFIGRFDVIFCRNMLMYFDVDSRARGISIMASRLADGGFLLLGHTESLLTMNTAFEPVHLSNSLVYRKAGSP